MAKKKKKSFWKKAAKAAVIGGALYAGAKGLKGLKGKGKSVADTAASEAANVGINTRPQRVYEDFKFRHKPYHPSDDIDVAYSAKGGRISKKGGGRTGKQFGGGLGSTARRDMRSGYYPNDMGMRGGTMYKKGGRVKSMGIAKRGGGAAKR